jgi:hypothetical protein
MASKVKSVVLKVGDQAFLLRKDLYAPYLTFLIQCAKASIALVGVVAGKSLEVNGTFGPIDEYFNTGFPDAPPNVRLS